MGAHFVPLDLRKEGAAAGRSQRGLVRDFAGLRKNTAADVLGRPWTRRRFAAVNGGAGRVKGMDYGLGLRLFPHQWGS